VRSALQRTCTAQVQDLPGAPGPKSARAQVAGEAVELLAAAAFAPEAGLPPPATRAAGFLRFLRLLGEHPWRERPLVVDPGAALGPRALRDMEAAFAQARARPRRRRAPVPACPVRE